MLFQWITFVYFSGRVFPKCLVTCFTLFTVNRATRFLVGRRDPLLGDNKSLVGQGSWRPASVMTCRAILWITRPLHMYWVFLVYMMMSNMPTFTGVVCTENVSLQQRTRAPHGLRLPTSCTFFHHPSPHFNHESPHGPRFVFDRVSIVYVHDRY